MEISPELNKRLREVLLRCGPLDDSSELRGLFVEARLAPWRNRVPEAKSAQGRVTALIEALHDQENERGENALLLFVQVLGDTMEPGTACRRDLAALARTLGGDAGVEAAGSLALSDAHRHRLVQLLALRGEILTSLDRQTLLEDAGLAQFIAKLPLGGSAEEFAAALVRTLQQQGQLPGTGEPALLPLLRLLRERVAGHPAEVYFLDELLAPYEVGRPLKLFVSYRRHSWPFTRHLAEALAQRLRAEIFIDYQKIDRADFASSIEQHLRTSDVVLLVVTRDTFGPRIHEAEDWLRREVALACALGKPLLLISVDGQLPPPDSDLPTDLHGLGGYQGIPFYPEYWEAALKRLVEFLTRITPAREAEESPSPTPPLSRSNVPTLQRSPTPQETLAEALRLLDEGDYEKAFFLLRELKERGASLRFLDLDQLLATALRHREEEQRARARDAAYAEIVLLERSRFTLPQARLAWAEFQAEHPAHDPEGLAPRLAVPAPAPAPRPRVSAEQQALLDTMLDPTIPPPERAVAGQRLAEIGDPRPGVGLRADGLPDIVWVEIAGGRCRIGGDEGAYQSLPAQEVALST
ncbi:MAG: toll/interleukin-1 receptor domain-containing protein, partial [Ardenticatenales bacterium]|nr:toll/interleukin-1 receptor domain-containing protein [Ardenticatenales bacterium]